MRCNVSNVFYLLHIGGKWAPLRFCFCFSFVFILFFAFVSCVDRRREPAAIYAMCPMYFTLISEESGLPFPFGFGFIWFFHLFFYLFFFVFLCVDRRNPAASRKVPNVFYLYPLHLGAKWAPFAFAFAFAFALLFFLIFFGHFFLPFVFFHIFFTFFSHIFFHLFLPPFFSTVFPCVDRRCPTAIRNHLPCAHECPMYFIPLPPGGEWEPFCFALLFLIFFLPFFHLSGCFLSGEVLFAAAFIL